ncbi:hypothetical protein ACEUZ9_002887 [Paracoccus litorisediminis]|uniref:hypothetical protein n=1 Tax=Paracoccus litorisediminis TaxID=2006130 RepID=UPI0037323282
MKSRVIQGVSLSLIVALHLAPLPAVSAESGGGSGAGAVSSGGNCAADGSYKDLVLGKEGGAAGYAATNPKSTATGAYQFLYGTLKSIGAIQSGPSSVPSGAGEWPSDVVWNPEFGSSREDFMNNPAAQDRALEIFTQQNLATVAGKWNEGEIINGVPMTSGGVALATHMLGTGGFQKWADSGFSASGLDAGIAAAHGWTPDQYNDHLMGRVAAGGCYDPNMIAISDASAKMELPQIYLMEWAIPGAVSVVLPGQLIRVGPR